MQAGELHYTHNSHAVEYWIAEGLPAPRCQQLHSLTTITGTPAWEAHLDALGIVDVRHRRIATEGALLGGLIAKGFSLDLAIISDGAGPFAILLHALCGVHAERLVHKLIPLNDQQRADQARVRGEIWALYADLKAYRRVTVQTPHRFQAVCGRNTLIHRSGTHNSGWGSERLHRRNPDPALRPTLEARFDEFFTQRTTYATLDRTLKRLHTHKHQFLRVLERPDLVLHTNGSEGDLRGYVKRRKISGGTRSDLGKDCRDGFASLKQTCRKLGISFWDSLGDRIQPLGAVPFLPDLIRERALAASATP